LSQLPWRLNISPRGRAPFRKAIALSAPVFSFVRRCRGPSRRWRRVPWQSPYPTG